MVNALLFHSLDQKRDYIREELIKRGEWHDAQQMQRMRENFSGEEDMAEILFGRMPLENVGEKPSKDFGRCQWCGETKLLVDGTYCRICRKG